MESYFFDQLVDILASGEQTGGSYSVSEVLGAQGFATPLHKHRDLDEGFYIVEGELTVWYGEEVEVLGAGDFLLAPRGVPHTIRNTGSADTRMLVVSTPAGFDDFVRAFGTPALTHDCQCSRDRPTSNERQCSPPRTASNLSDLPECCQPNCHKPKPAK